MHEVLVNRLGGLRLPRKSVVRLTDRPGMTLDVYRGRKTTTQQTTTTTKWLLYILSGSGVKYYGTPEGTFSFRYLSEKKLKQGD